MSSYLPISTLQRRRSKQRLSKNTSPSVGSECSFERKGYKHHVVCLRVWKDTCEVFHISGTTRNAVKGSMSSDDKAGLRRNFTEIKSISHIYNYGTVAFSAETIRNRAYFIWNNRQNLVNFRYNIFHFNCHHLASYVVTGQVYSKKSGSCCCGVFSNMSTDEDNDARRKTINSE